MSTGQVMSQNIIIHKRLTFQLQHSHQSLAEKHFFVLGKCIILGVFITLETVPHLSAKWIKVLVLPLNNNFIPSILSKEKNMKSLKRKKKKGRKKTEGSTTFRYLCHASQTHSSFLLFWKQKELMGGTVELSNSGWTRGTGTEVQWHWYKRHM